MKIDSLSRKLVLGSVLLAQSVSHAAPYVLAQTPRNTAVPEPAPNVIVSVDNSGSMAYSSNSSDGSVAPPAGVQTRMQALQTALKANFAESKIPNNRIRLAWQTMNKNGDNSCVGFFGDTTAGPYGATPCTIGGHSQANLMQSLDAPHRGDFFTWVDNMTASDGTPLHAMMTRAGEYMKTTGTYSPYSDNPGVPDAVQSSCRKSYHIFMTDGEYNLFGFNNSPTNLQMPAVGNKDGTDTTLPDGTAYVARAPFRDAAGALNDPSKWTNAGTSASPKWLPTEEYRPTLADLSFHYWASDLQPTVANNLNKTIKQGGTVTVGTAAVPEYWNPKNDPANWQHLTTSTIGFGTAASWAGHPTIQATATDPSYSGDYAGLVDGTVTWADPLSGTLSDGVFLYSDGTRWYSTTHTAGFYHEGASTNDTQKAAVRTDLWHAAINGRGTFTPASNATALSNAFSTIVQDILKNTSAPLTSISANSSKVSTSTAVYQAGYDTADWTGNVQRTAFNSDGTLNAIPTWSARGLLDTQVAGTAFFGGRTVLTSSAGTGTAFAWANLSLAQKGALQGAPVTSTTDTATGTALGRGVLNFLRGDRSNEGSATTLGLRVRTHVLGDIVGSSVWYAGKPNSGFTTNNYGGFVSDKGSRTAMLYVGANDGMLHGFNAGTGAEVFAYVPEGLYGSDSAPDLKKLSMPSYAHKYFVDGSAFVGDVYTGTATDTTDAAKKAKWKSVLVGTLGAGGKGYFVLDVTNPAGITESGAASTVLLDTTATTDADIGYQFQQPAIDGYSKRPVQITMLNDDKSAVILGNGYNSTSEKAVLLIQYLDGTLKKIEAPTSQGAGTANGLSAPQVIDKDGDGKADYVYAGDLLGNMWKFDLTAKDATLWKVTTAGTTATDNQPLFTTPRSGTGGTTVTQPITAAPIVVQHPRGGFLVAFGTGRLFASGDESIAATQALYGIWDKPGDGTVAQTDLVEQVIDSATVNVSGTTYRTLTAGSVPLTGTGAKRGWFVSLPTSKERVLFTGNALSNTMVSFSTTIPGTASDATSCASGTSDSGWAMAINLYNGGASTYDIFQSGDTINGLTFVGASGTDGTKGQTFTKPGEGGDAGTTGTTVKQKICYANGTCVDPMIKTVTRRFGWRDLVPGS